jgi:hypothetical protein
MLAGVIGLTVRNPVWPVLRIRWFAIGNSCDVELLRMSFCTVSYPSGKHAYFGVHVLWYLSVG